MKIDYQARWCPTFSRVRTAFIVGNRRIIFIGAALSMSFIGVLIWRSVGSPEIFSSQTYLNLIGSWGIITAFVNALVAAHAAIPVPSLVLDLFSADPEVRSFAECFLSSPHRARIYLVYNPLVIHLLGVLTIVTIFRAFG